MFYKNEYKLIKVPSFILISKNCFRLIIGDIQEVNKF